VSDTMRRAVLLILVLVTVTGGSAADRLVARGSPATLLSVPASALVAGPAASTSAWYCAGSAAAPAGTSASVVVTNPFPRPLSGAVEAYGVGPGAGTAAVSIAFEAPAGGQVSVPLTAAAAARVVLDGGGAGVFEVLSGAIGWTTAPCDSTTAVNWLFAHGSTAPGRAMYVSLFNPSATESVVDLSFVSATAGLVVPPAYQGIPVPAGSVVVEDVSDHVQNDASLATSVVALSGTVVASEVLEAGTAGNGGVSILAGDSAPRPQWAFPQNDDVTGGGTVFTVFNPSSRPAPVTVTITLAEGQAAPLHLELPSMSTATVAAQDQTRIPSNAPFAVRFDAPAPGIVVGREAFSPPGPTTPTDGETSASPGAERRWLLPAVPPPGHGTWALGILNMAGRAVHVSVGIFDGTGRFVALAGERAVTLRRAGFLELGPAPPAPIGQVPLSVVADGPVAVELDPEPIGAPGTVVLGPWALLSPEG